MPAAGAVRIGSTDPALTYLEARAAAMDGNHARAASLLATLAQAQPGKADLNLKATSEAINAGRMDLALQLARRTSATLLTSDARLLLAADELRQGRDNEAIGWLAPAGSTGGLAFLTPLVSAWAAADRGDLAGALKVLDDMPDSSLLAPIRDEHRAFILLKFRQLAQAAPLAEQASANGDERSRRLRLAYADGFLAAGDQAHALAIVDGLGIGAPAARDWLRTHGRNGSVIDTGAKAFSETLIAFAGEVAQLQHSAPPLGLIQIARFADPQNGSATLMLAQVYQAAGQTDNAIGALRTLADDDPAGPRARDLQTRILTDAKRYDEALAVAQPLATRPNPTIDDLSRLGDVYSAMKRPDDAAAAYAKSVALAREQGVNEGLWPLLLIQAGALEDGKHYAEAQSAVEQALVIAPDQPLLLNFLGYTELVRGQNVEAAEAMIRKASALAPDDASIADSLGWAEYKRGKMADAISTLQSAAQRDPQQAEIQEHLGDALFSNGEHLEARFAWQAALVTADDEVAARAKAKIASGLTPANAAP